MMAGINNRREIWAMADEPHLEAMKNLSGGFKSRYLNYSSRLRNDSDDDTISMFSISTLTSSRPGLKMPRAPSFLEKETFKEFEAIPEEFRPHDLGENLYEIIERPIDVGKKLPRTFSSSQQQFFRDPSEMEFVDTQEKREAPCLTQDKFFRSHLGVQKTVDVSERIIETGVQRDALIREQTTFKPKQELSDTFSKMSLKTNAKTECFLKNNDYLKEEGKGSCKKNFKKFPNNRNQARNNHTYVPKQTGRVTWKNDFCNLNQNHPPIRCFRNNVLTSNPYESKEKADFNENLQTNLRFDFQNKAGIKRNNRTYRNNDTRLQKKQEQTHFYKRMADNGKINDSFPRKHYAMKEKKIESNSEIEINKTSQYSTSNLSIQESEFTTQSSTNASTECTPPKKTCDATQRKLRCIRERGKDIADLIIGSYDALNLFLNFYNEWMDRRRETLSLFEKLSEKVKGTSKKDLKKISVAEFISGSGKMASMIPHPTVSIAARAISALADLFLKSYKSKDSSNEGYIDLLPSLQKDINLTSDIYIYALQCSHQFQETCENIEFFHKSLKDGEFEDLEEDDEFLKKLSDLNSRNINVFYKRLQLLYQRQNISSNASRAFCGDFEDYPDAPSVISKLRWRPTCFNHTVSDKTWEEICDQLQRSSGEELYPKIRDSLCILTKERDAIEENVKEILRSDSHETSYLEKKGK